MRQAFLHWRTNFVAGLAIVLPAVVSVAVVVWLFGTVSTITDTLLVFLPRGLTHQRGGEGPLWWYWSAVAFTLGVLLVTGIGALARYYLGKKAIQLMDHFLSSVPLLNKVYSTVKQVNDAFSTSKSSSFKQVVLVEYPRKGSYTIGFITTEEIPEVNRRLDARLVGVFVPTTPNPTSGFLILVPEDEVVHLRMSVAEGIKCVISLGSIVPGDVSAMAVREKSQREAGT